MTWLKMVPLLWLHHISFLDIPPVPPFHFLWFSTCLALSLSLQPLLSGTNPHPIVMSHIGVVRCTLELCLCSKPASGWVVGEDLAVWWGLCVCEKLCRLLLGVL